MCENYDSERVQGWSGMLMKYNCILRFCFIGNPWYQKMTCKSLETSVLKLDCQISENYPSMWLWHVLYTIGGQTMLIKVELSLSSMKIVQMGVISQVYDTFSSIDRIHWRQICPLSSQAKQNVCFVIDCYLLKYSANTLYKHVRIVIESTLEDMLTLRVINSTIQY